MAEVELARVVGPASFEKRVVIKRMLPTLLGDEQLVGVFEREARLSALIEHPNVVQVSDFGRDESGRPYLVMEFVDGLNLREALRLAWKQPGGPDRRLIAWVFAQAATGLAAVHDAVDPKTGVSLQLVHRDVSPDNLLLSRHGAVKVSDFGIARAMQEAPMTSPHLIRGKINYLSPEQLRSEPVTRAVDQFALGVCLYEALYCARPFAGDNESAVMYAIAQGLRADVTAHAPACDPRLVAIVDRCLQNAPEARFPDCHALADALSHFVHESGPSVTAVHVGAWVAGLKGVPQTPAFIEVPIDVSTAPALAARFSTPESSLLPDVPVRPMTPVAAAVARPVTPSAPVPVEAAPAAPAVTGSARAPLEPRPSRRWWVVPVLVAVAGLAVWGSGVMRPQPKSVQVVVTSRPGNATVSVDELEVGPTPWAGDLTIGAEHVISVKAAGFAPWSVKLDAGVGGSLEATLKRR